MTNRKDIRICFVGDSFTNGTEDKTHLSWTGQLCTLLQNSQTHITHYNLGIRRDTSEDIKQRWEAECLRRLPPHSENHVIFCFGTNDTYIENNKQRTDKTNSIENARQILLSAKARYKTTMIGPMPMNDPAHNARIAELDAAFQELCNSINVAYLSVCHHLMAEDIWMRGVLNNPDNHADADGYAYLARLVYAWEQWR